MAAEQTKKSFAEEFEELKARHGAWYADLTTVRFTDPEGDPADFQEYVSYSCRRDHATGDIVCVKQRI